MKFWVAVGACLLAMCGSASAAPCGPEQRGILPGCVVFTADQDAGQWFSARGVRTGYAYELLAPWGRVPLHPVPGLEWISRYKRHGIFVEVCACRERSGPSSIRFRYSAKEPTPLLLQYSFG